MNICEITIIFKKEGIVSKIHFTGKIHEMEQQGILEKARSNATIQDITPMILKERIEQETETIIKISKKGEVTYDPYVISGYEVCAFIGRAIFHRLFLQSLNKLQSQKPKKKGLYVPQTPHIAR